MNIPEFIEKNSLYKDFFINELNEKQIKDFKSCKEFKNTRKFNIVDYRDNFYINNAIDFPITKLKTDTKFNYKVNILSVSVIGPFPVRNINLIKEGLSGFKYVDENQLKEKGIIIYKFDFENLKDKYLTQKEIENFIFDDIKKSLVEDIKTENYYLIGIRAHKESFIKEPRNGEDIMIPVKTDKNKLFK